MKVEIGKWTVKAKFSRKGFAVVVDTPKDKAVRAEIRQMNNNFRARNLRAIG